MGANSKIHFAKCNNNSENKAMHLSSASSVSNVLNIYHYSFRSMNIVVLYLSCSRVYRDHQTHTHFFSHTLYSHTLRFCIFWPMFFSYWLQFCILFVHHHRRHRHHHVHLHYTTTHDVNKTHHTFCVCESIYWCR